MKNFVLEENRVVCNRIQCNRVIGELNLERYVVFLGAVRKGWLDPVATLHEYMDDGVMMTTVISGIKELESTQYDPFDVNTPGVCEENYLSLMSVSGYKSRESCDIDDEGEVKKKKKRVVKKRKLIFSPKIVKDHISGVIESVVKGWKKKKNAIKAVTRNEYSIRKISRSLKNISMYDDLASLLPNEELCEF